MSEPKIEIKFMEYCWQNMGTYRLLQNKSPDFKQDCKKLEQNLLRSQIIKIESKLIQFMHDYIKQEDSLDMIIKRFYPELSIAVRVSY